ncbi:hypothetical protein [Amycolatopsis sp. FDAARGOS 1241]|uniref:hypothetical protein n=1 Tax=Amycolatopsis sp. FDAARGOS 1241 TaxID=2778070 RepID=UPI001EF3A56B|nr:hypothetical protein [Amycolatopsis sp. FDAARGOS 1241]
MGQPNFADAAELTAYTRERQWSLLLGGELKPAAAGRRFDDVSPVTGELIAEVPVADASDVDAAVTAGLHAFPA